jgi:anti-sigma regulatory factor (Ser/Thr protein kinase)
MMMEFNYEIKGGDFSKAGFASSNLKKMLKQINTDPKLIKRIVIALYEAEMNIVAHAYDGKIKVKIAPEQIVINVSDRGPGIEDIDKAMEDGYSTASDEVREMGFGAGMGLSNIKNNTDQLDIESTVGKGTVLKIVTKLS